MKPTYPTKSVQKSKMILTAWLAILGCIAYGQTDFSIYSPDRPENQILSRLSCFFAAGQSESGGFPVEYAECGSLIPIISMTPSFTGKIETTDIGKYWGGLRASAPEGLGMSLKADEYLQIGEFRSGKLSGYGYRLKRSTLYMGHFENGKPEGHGSIYVFRDTTEFASNAETLMNGGLLILIRANNIANVYHGLFTQKEKGQRFDGRIIRGAYESAESEVRTRTATYIGRTEEGESIGSAMIEEKLGNDGNLSTVYFGPAKGLKPAGIGVLYFMVKETKSAIRFEADLTNGTIGEFSGKALHANGNRLEGKFTSLTLNGYGKILTREMEYEGEVVKEIPSGKGTIVYKDGTRFTGTWAAGMAVSGSTYHPSTGETLTGNYKEGKLHGMVEITKDGVTKKVEYIDGNRKEDAGSAPQGGDLGLTGKTFEYETPAGDIERYHFRSSTSATLTMLTFLNGKTFQDNCECVCSITVDKVSVVCECEDKEVFPDPLKETFIYDKATNSMKSTIQLEQTMKPKIFRGK